MPQAKTKYLLQLLTNTKQVTQLLQRDRATLRVIEYNYFAKSLKITQDHSTLHCSVGRESRDV